jgi:hypothetical protein
LCVEPANNGQILENVSHSAGWLEALNHTKTFVLLSWLDSGW